MKTFAWIAAAGLLFAPAIVRAQAVPSSAECRFFLVHLPRIVLDGEPGSAAGSAPNACHYEDVRIKLSKFSGMRASTIDVQGIDFDPGASGGPPLTLRATAHGITNTIHSGNAAFDYLNLQMAGGGFDLTLDVTYDPTARTWLLREASLDGERVGRTSIDGEVDGLGPVRDLDTPPSNPQAIAVRRLHLRLDSRNFVALFILPQIVEQLPQGATVDEVEAGVRREADRIAGLARTLLVASGASATTIAAVTGVITDFPRPRHPFEATATAADPVRAYEVAVALESSGDTLGGLSTLARRVMVEASYAGGFRP